MSAAPDTVAAGHALDVSNVDVAYRVRGRDRLVLRDVSFHIRKGESYGLVGESGSGKSTMALALMRYLPRNGRVRSGGIMRSTAERHRDTQRYSRRSDQRVIRRATELARPHSSRRDLSVGAGLTAFIDVLTCLSGRGHSRGGEVKWTERTHDRQPLKERDGRSYRTT